MTLGFGLLFFGIAAVCIAIDAGSFLSQDSTVE